MSTVLTKRKKEAKKEKSTAAASVTFLNELTRTQELKFKGQRTYWLGNATDCPGFKRFAPCGANLLKCLKYKDFRRFSSRDENLCNPLPSKFAKIYGKDFLTDSAESLMKSLFQ